MIDTQWKTLAVFQDRTKISQAKLEMAQVNKTTQADQDQFAKCNYELTACFNIPIIKELKNSSCSTENRQNFSFFTCSNHG